MSKVFFYRFRISKALYSIKGPGLCTFGPQENLAVRARWPCEHAHAQEDHG